MALCDKCLFWEECDFEIDTDVLRDPNRKVIGGECKMERLYALFGLIDTVEADTVEEFVNKVVDMYKDIPVEK